MNSVLKLAQSKVGIPIVGSLVFLISTVLFFETPAPPSEAPSPSTPTSGSALTILWNYQNGEADRLVEELKREREQLHTREEHLRELEARLQAERAEISQVTQAVALMQKEFDLAVLRVKEEETANLKKLAKVYAGMTPEAAAAILREMTDDQIAKIFLHLKDVDTAPLLEAFSSLGPEETKRAAIISERLRLAIPPTTSDKK